MDSTPFIHVDVALRNAVDAAIAPGAVLVAGCGATRHEAALGHTRAEPADGVAPGARAVSAATLFDLASLTKVLATTWLAMQETAAGRLDLDAPLGDLLPGYYPADKRDLTVRLLMCHAAGLPSGLRLRSDLRPDAGGVARRRASIERFLQAPVEAAPGSRTLYSDIGPILVGDLLERLAGDDERLDRLCDRRLYAPLGLRDTFFRHLDEPLPTAQRPTWAFAATEVCPWRRRTLAGEVHDENAHLLRGVAGHAGLFSHAGDLETIARAWLDGGPIGVDADTRARLTAPQGMAPDSARAFGWDKPRPDGPGGSRLSPAAYGHTGFTGTSLYIDPETGTYVILLTNRVHPTRADRGFGALRPQVHDLAIAALEAAAGG